jgi:hypothetical protein
VELFFSYFLCSNKPVVTEPAKDPATIPAAGPARSETPKPTIAPTAAPAMILTTVLPIFSQDLFLKLFRIFIIKRIYFDTIYFDTFYFLLPSKRFK